MGRIQTGVDKLVALLHEKKKVTVDDAAKALGVSKMILQEWADFLQEEGLLEIKYSLSKTYLIEKVLTKRESQDKERKFEDQRETFIKKVDGAITSLQSESSGFETFKKEFLTIKDELGADLDTIQKEMDELKEYETLKKRAADDLQKQRALYQEKEMEAETTIKRHYQQYQDVMHAISQQEARMAQQKTRVHQLLESEETVGKKLEEYSKLLEQLQKRVDSETSQLGMDEGGLEKLRQTAIKFRQGLDDLNKNNLQPLEDLRKKHEERVKQVESAIIAKATSIDKTMKRPELRKQVMSKKLEEFFKRKKDIEVLLEQIEKEKLDLMSDLKALQVRAEAYRLGQPSARLEELESKLGIIEEKQKGLRGHITKFLGLLN